ncbi:MAG: PIN domain-containing protein [Armatimonadota bacterium]
MFLIDSVGWLAYFMNDALASDYEPYLLTPERLICSSLNIYEVCRRIEHSAGRKAAAEAVAQMQKTTIIPVDDQIVTAAASSSITHHLAMADAIIYATAQLQKATLVTSDTHLAGLPGVTLIPHPNTVKSS